MCGASTLRGDLVICPIPQLTPGEHTGVKFARTVLPTAASPWTLYRTQFDAMAVRSISWIELAHPGKGGDPTRNRFIVGTSDESGAFCRCLTVRADCTVIAHQDLAVTGSLMRSPSEVDRNDPRYAQAAIDAFVQGFVGAAQGVVGALSAVALSVTVSSSSEGPPTAGNIFSYTVTLTNSGSIAATSGQIYVLISIDAEIQPSDMIRDGLTFEREQLHRGARALPYTP